MTYKVDVLRLKMARLQNGYSQAALASKSGVAFATVSPIAEIYKLEA